MEKIRVLLSQVDDAIAQDKSAADEAVSFTPEVLTEIASELRQSLSEQSVPKSKEEKKTVREKQKQGDMPINGGHNVSSVPSYMLIGDLQRHYKTKIMKIAA